MIKLVFFDFDNTISENHFDELERIQKSYDGLSPQASRYLSQLHFPEKVFAECKPVNVMRNAMYYFTNEGAKIALLSWCTNPILMELKKKFCEEHYTGLFDFYAFSQSRTDKLEWIQAYCAYYGIALSECLLIDDDFETLSGARKLGIQTMSIVETCNTFRK